jgi:hypothetical protein
MHARDRTTPSVASDADESPDSFEEAGDSFKPDDLIEMMPKMVELNRMLMLLMLKPWPEKLALIEEKADTCLDRMIYTTSFAYFADVLSREPHAEELGRLGRFHFKLFERCRLDGIRSTREDAALRAEFESLLASLREA